MSGIITSRRMASGSIDSASAVPADPPFAVVTVQPSVNSRLSLATSRMSFSSSITRSCLGGMLHLFRTVRDVLQQPDYVLFELGQTASTLRQELGRPHAKPRPIHASDIQRRVDEKGDAPKGRTFSQRADHRVAVHVGKDEIEEDQTRLVLPAQLNRFAAV